MTKSEFLSVLRRGLSGIPDGEIEERISFYGEMIDDRIEEGLSEEEAVANLGSADDVISQILSEIPLSHIVREKVRPKRQLKAWEIALIVIGFPVWLPILISVFAIILSLFIVAIAVAVAVYSVVISLAVGSIGGVALGAVKLFTGGGAVNAFCWFGAALIAAGLSILLFLLCGKYDHGIAAAAKKLIHGIKKIFIGKKDD